MPLFIDYVQSPNNKTEDEVLFTLFNRSFENESLSLKELEEKRMMWHARDRTEYILFVFNRKLAKLREEGKLSHVTDLQRKDGTESYTGEVDQDGRACGYGQLLIKPYEYKSIKKKTLGKTYFVKGKTYEGTFFNDVFEGVVIFNDGWSLDV